MARVRAARPGVTFVAEQADWHDYGEPWLTRGGVDAVFAFRLRDAIVSLDKAKIETAIAETAATTPAGKRQFVQIENHDVDRFASLVAGDPAKARLGAAFDLFLQGTPLIYYGQELGMRGLKSHAWGTDANDIPQREAFRWSADDAAVGAATWYQGDWPWWKDRFNRSHDGVSVEEEERDPASLLNWYRKLISLRRARPEWHGGDQIIACPKTEHIVCLLRTARGARSLLIANLSAEPATIPVDASHAWAPLIASGAELVGEKVSLAPWGVAILGR
jgi:glycosidase